MGTNTYSIDGTNYVASNVFGGLVAGTYTLYVKDLESCICSDQVTITQPAVALTCEAAETNAVTCYGGSDGEAQVTAVGGWIPYSYSWNTTPVQTTQTATGLTAGTYIVTVTDNAGCQSSCSVIITQPATALSCTAAETNAVTCYGGSDGEAQVTAVGGWIPYSYSWNTTPVQTTQTATGLTAGTYIVTVTDNAGCQSSCSVIITQPATALSCTAAETNAVTCYGGSDGEAQLRQSAVDPIQLQLEHDAGTDDTDRDRADGRNLYVTVTDNAGCQSSCSVIITQPATALSCTAAETNAVTCYGGSDGEAQVTAVGGWIPYSYSWNTTPVQTTQTATGLTAGTYIVTVTDNAGCQSSCSVIITSLQQRSAARRRRPTR